MLSELAIPNGTMIFANITACNTNKALWGEDALEWRPERWLEPFPRALEEARIPGIYQHQFTFIGGGYACMCVGLLSPYPLCRSRFCISGFKFSQLEMSTFCFLCVFDFWPDMSSLFGRSRPLNSRRHFPVRALGKAVCVEHCRRRLPRSEDGRQEPRDVSQSVACFGVMNARRAVCSTYYPMHEWHVSAGRRWFVGS